MEENNCGSTIHPGIINLSNLKTIKFRKLKEKIYNPLFSSGKPSIIPIVGVIKGIIADIQAEYHNLSDNRSKKRNI